MTITELIKELTSIESEGHGDKIVSLMIETPRGHRTPIQLQFDLNSMAIGKDQVILMHEEWTSIDDENPPSGAV